MEIKLNKRIRLYGERVQYMILWHFYLYSHTCNIYAGRLTFNLSPWLSVSLSLLRSILSVVATANNSLLTHPPTAIRIFIILRVWLCLFNFYLGCVPVRHQIHYRVFIIWHLIESYGCSLSECSRNNTCRKSSLSLDQYDKIPEKHNRNINTMVSHPIQDISHI